MMSWLILFGFFTLLGLRIYHFLSGKRLVLDLIDLWILSRKRLQSCDEFSTKNKHQSDIIVSLTTLPSRIEKLDITLKSLLTQALSPQQINLYIPEFSERENVPYEVPKRFTTLRNLKVIRVKVDWGPATKFIPALESSHSDQKILVVDDDNFYPKTYLADFGKWSNQLPDAVLTASGWKIPADMIDKPTTLWSNINRIPPTPLPGTRIKQPLATDIVQGFAGYLIKKSFFNLDELTNYEGTPKAARFVDDLWISVLCKAEKYIIPVRRFCFVPFHLHRFYKKSSLARINSPGTDHEKRNNTVMLQYFAKKQAINNRL